MAVVVPEKVGSGVKVMRPFWPTVQVPSFGTLTELPQLPFDPLMTRVELSIEVNGSAVVTMDNVEATFCALLAEIGEAVGGVTDNTKFFVVVAFAETEDD